MKLSFTIELDLEAHPFPEPLPLPDLMAEFMMRQKALDSLLNSSSFPAVVRSMVAQWVIEDGGVALAQALANRVSPRDSHLMLAAMNQRQESLVSWIVEKYIRRGSVDDLMKDVTSRLRFGAIEVTHASIDHHDQSAESSGALAGTAFRTSRG